MNDEDLSEEQKQARVKELETMLPEKIRQQRAAARVHDDLRATEEEMRASGASDEELYAVRSQALGDEAAQRLADLDERRADFTRRLREYRSEKESLDSTAMDEADKANALLTLRQSYFSEKEIRRVNALDKLGME
jgi:lipase chaperone LimK